MRHIMDGIVLSRWKQRPRTRADLIGRPAVQYRWPEADLQPVVTAVSVNKTVRYPWTPGEVNLILSRANRDTSWTGILQYLTGYDICSMSPGPVRHCWLCRHLFPTCLASCQAGLCSVSVSMDYNNSVYHPGRSKT